MAQGFCVQQPFRLTKPSTDAAIAGALVPADDWSVQTYEVNSTTPMQTFADGQLATPNANPVPADADGYVRIFIGQGDTVKCVVLDESDVPQYTFDYQQPMIADPAAGSVTAVPTGGILAWSTTSAPTGFLLCDGSAVSRATFSALNTLLSAAGYPFGNGDGASTFNVPDMRGKFPLGTSTAGTGSTLGGTGGAIDHTHTGPSHTHTTLVPITGWGGTQAAGVSPQGTMLASDGAVLNLTIAQTTQTITSSASGTGNTGTANPPFLSLTWIIKT